jgi:Glycosyl hydrolase family 79, N-terminal domain
MISNDRAGLHAAVVLLSLAISMASAGWAKAQAVLAPATMPRIGTVAERYQSYNVEMAEVTGGEFWKPYKPADRDAALYQYRPPLDLTNARLRELAAALRPAYVRISGTWANTTYFSDSDQAPTEPPAGFIGVLTRPQWQGVVEFAKAVDAEIITSLENGIGARDPAGAWTTEQAKRLFAYTRWVGGRIAAAEFMNEPTMGGEPAGYDAAAYGRDFKIFHAFARQEAPGMLILGPDAAGETAGEWGVASGNMPKLKTRDLLAASRPAGVDGFSYHHYGAMSQRCAAFGLQTTAEAALSQQWLRRTDETLAFYRKLRDEFEPGKPLWLTETADASCGGNPWAGTFLDTFRYLDQLGRLAKQDVRVVAHNTLIGSDYGLLNEKTLEAKPNYWGALLWRRLMGSTVLESGVPLQPGLHLYAHCLRGTPAGVALLAINNRRTQATSIDIPIAMERYTLAAKDLEGTQVELNGKELKLQSKGELPDLQAIAARAGAVELAPASITFLAVAGAGNTSCLS